MLDRHSRLAIPPETAFYPRIAAGVRGADGARLADVLSGWRRSPELGLDIEGLVRDCPAPVAPGPVLAAVLGQYARTRGKPYAGEKTPRHWRSLGAILEDFPQARVLFMIRDGRDAALSLSRMPWWRYDLRAAADVWLAAGRAALESLEAHPPRVRLVRYEDLVCAPEPTLQTVMDFIGLDRESAQLDPDTPSGVVLARSMPWKGGALGPMDRSRVGHWKATATHAEIALLDEALGPELSRLGYV
jgi:hypothetical protein